MVISRETKFTGRVISLDVEQVSLPNGHVATLEVVRHPGGAAIVVIDAQRRICMLRQYRHVAGGWIWELPAGKLEPDEAPLATAQREIQEEGGVTAAEWKSLGSYLSSPGVFDEVVHLYLARGLTTVPIQPEPSEVFEVHWLPFEQVHAQALDGELIDGKTCVGVLRAAGQVGGET